MDTPCQKDDIPEVQLYNQRPFYQLVFQLYLYPIMLKLLRRFHFLLGRQTNLSILLQ